MTKECVFAKGAKKAILFLADIIDFVKMMWIMGNEIKTAS